MFSTAHTIVAIATPPGRGGIGVVRLSGPEAHASARQLIAHDGPLEPRRATFTSANGEADAALFDLIARLEASVDFPEEGYHFVVAPTLATEIDRLIDRSTALLADARRGRLVREGLQVVIAGRPNVGKSSVFNALAGAARAIVAEVPGTTRDLVTEVIDLDGLRVTLIDTAGQSVSADAVASEGVYRARRATSRTKL